MTDDNATPRRDYLKKVGVLTSGTALTGLAGCTSSGNPSSGSPSTNSSGGSSTSGDPAVREEYGLPDLGYELEGTLNVFQWADYWPQGTVEKFEKAYGVTVNVSNYASNEEMFNKLKAGGTGQFDVIFPSDYMINVLTQQQMIQPLDLQMLPHWGNLEQRWIDNAPYDPGEKRYSVPYQWGTSGIGVNANMTPDASVTSWDALWDEAYAGQITMMNDMRETIGAALKRLGYSLNSKSESEIAEAKETLIQQKDLLLTYESTTTPEMLINKSASPIHLWSGDAFRAYWELYDDESGSSPIKYQVPNEGSVVWIDTAAVTKDSKHPNAAHAFINYTLNAKVNAMISNYVYYPSPNAAAKEYIDDAALNNPAIYPPEETMENLEFIKNIGQATKLYSEAWSEIQNA